MTTPHNSAQTGGASTKDKIKGTVEVLHGIGENIRGRVSETLDQPEGGHPATAQGREEVERGFARIRGEKASGANPALGAVNHPNAKPSANTLGAGAASEKGENVDATHRRGDQQGYGEGQQGYGHQIYDRQPPAPQQDFGQQSRAQQPEDHRQQDYGDDSAPMPFTRQTGHLGDSNPAAGRGSEPNSSLSAAVASGAYGHDSKEGGESGNQASGRQGQYGLQGDQSTTEPYVGQNRIVPTPSGGENDTANVGSSTGASPRPGAYDQAKDNNVDTTDSASGQQEHVDKLTPDSHEGGNAVDGPATSDPLETNGHGDDNRSEIEGGQGQVYGQQIYDQQGSDSSQQARGRHSIPDTQAGMPTLSKKDADGSGGAETPGVANNQLSSDRSAVTQGGNGLGDDSNAGDTAGGHQAGQSTEPDPYGGDGSASNPPNGIRGGRGNDEEGLAPTSGNDRFEGTNGKQSRVLSSNSQPQHPQNGGSEPTPTSTGSKLGSGGTPADPRDSSFGERQEMH